MGQGYRRVYVGRIPGVVLDLYFDYMRDGRITTRVLALYSTAFYNLDLHVLYRFRNGNAPGYA